MENTFGIMTMTFRIFLRPIEMKIDSVSLLVCTTCLLNNYLRFEQVDEDYNRELLATYLIIEREMISLQPIPNYRGPAIHRIREKFADYFNNLHH